MLVIPFIIVFTGFTGWYLYTSDYSQGLIYGLTSLFFILVIVVFDPMVVAADSEKIILKLGPIKNTILIKDIATIRSVEVRPLRDYMGVGKRLGSDGSIGYIAYLKTGVKMELKDKKVYVATLKNPQDLVDFVRYFRKN